MTAVYIYVVIVALFWGSWPLILRAAGDVGHTGVLLLSASALIPLSIIAVSTGVTMPQTSAVPKLLIAGCIMGAGMVAYNLAIGEGTIEMSILIPIMNAGMLIVTTIGGIWFFDESFTAQKAIGIILMLIGVVLLRPTG